MTSKINYGELFEKMAGDAGKIARKGFDTVKGVATKDNAEKLADQAGNVVDAVKDIAQAATDGWNEADREDKVDPPEDHVRDAVRTAAGKVRNVADSARKGYEDSMTDDSTESNKTDAGE